MGSRPTANCCNELVEKLKQAPGFMYHVAFVDQGGVFTVSEIWGSKEQYDRWFSENIEGVIPGRRTAGHQSSRGSRAVADAAERRRLGPSECV
jgi:hypothetical protein